MILGPVVQEEMSFKEKVYGTDDGQKDGQWTTDEDRSQYFT